MFARGAHRVDVDEGPVGCVDQKSDGSASRGVSRLSLAGVEGVAVTTNSSNPVPVNLIGGPLGVGKTTVINHLLSNKPSDERWAVLVNEYV